MKPRRASLVAGLAVFALHATLLVAVPVDSEFLKYPGAAAQLVRGEMAVERLVDFSPLYLEVHGLGLALFGEQPVPEPTGSERARDAIRWLQAAAVAVALGALFSLLDRRFPRWLAVTTLAVLALERHLLVYGRILEPEALLLAAVTLFVVMLSGPRPTPGRAAVAGIAGAVALGLRPSVLPLLAAGLVALLAVRPPRRRRAVAAVLLVAPLAVALALLAGRASRATGDPRTPFMNPGTVFFEGNNPLSRGTSAVYPPVVMRFARYLGGSVPDSAHVHYREVARESTAEALSVREVNGYWAGRAAAFLRDHPGHAFSLLRQKLVHAFHAHRWHDVPSAFGIESTLPLPSFPFSFFAALGLVGLLLAARRWRAHFLLYALAAAQLAVMAAFYVSARQRLLLLPAVAWFAAVAVERLARRPRRPLLALLVVLLAIAFTVPTGAVVDHRQEELAELEAGGIAAEIRRRLAAGEPSPSLRSLFLDLGALRSGWHEPPAYFPQDDESYAVQLADRLAADPAARPFARATAALRAGRPEVAEALFRELAERGEQPYERGAQAAEPHFYLGRIAALRGDTAAALAHLEAALAAAPGDPFVLAELVVVGGGGEHQALLRRYWSDLDAQLLLGEALRVHGRPREAAAAFAFVVRRLPELRLARLRLAESLALAGDDAQAVALFRHVLASGVEPAWGSEAIVPLFERWLEEHDDDPAARLLAARVFHLYGRYRLAATVLDEPGGSTTPALAAERRRVLAGLAAASTAAPAR